MHDEDIRHPEFIPRGAAPGLVKSTLQTALDLLTLGARVNLVGEVIEGTVSKLERHKLPQTRQAYASGAGMRATSFEYLWLEEHGDTVIGHVLPYVLHETKVGHKVRVTVRPDSGKIRKIKNYTKPRPWYVF
ncbi:hypothetical protein N4R57_21390 [Rhodobacteraceae bacterium D3-12]|nr:hypothetical protein N4R57_21390 [Rhodobacteraceae bacterium D3-12]